MAPSFPIALALIIMCTMLLSPSRGAMGMDHDILMLGKFHRWMSVHNRSYPSAAEKLRRFEVYQHNVKYIHAMNVDGALGYGLGENEFTDLTNEEFRASYTSGKFTRTNDAILGEPIITTLVGDVHEGGRATMESLRIPVQFDWRDKGAVTPAKNQRVARHRCESCWAFAAVAALEGQVKIKNGELLDISEQELVDCDGTNQGCQGGLAAKALEWIKRNKGIRLEVAYPYVGYKQPTCRIRKEGGDRRVGLIVQNYSVQKNEQALAQAVLNTPVVVAIDTSDPNLQHFTNGIYKGPCGISLDHEVVVVGFGETAGEKYWIVKNSWGQTWAENGFFLMRRGADGDHGLCGIALDAVFPSM